MEELNGGELIVLEEGDDEEKVTSDVTNKLIKQCKQEAFKIIEKENEPLEEKIVEKGENEIPRRRRF